MNKQSLCSPSQVRDEPECGAQTNLVLEAQRIVFWAGELTEPGERVGSIGTQIQRASRLLRLHHGVVWRAWYERSGPEIFPCIWEARCQLVERIAAQQARRSPWSMEAQPPRQAQPEPRLQTALEAGGWRSSRRA